LFECAIARVTGVSNRNFFKIDPKATVNGGIKSRDVDISYASISKGNQLPENDFCADRSLLLPSHTANAMPETALGLKATWGWLNSEGRNLR